ncbi:MAG TPA: hypothetical protein VFV33_21570 [Gemmatimonadaceae bacterium]|nr:hypothetical protein [Gemmatimonadaceae bacterium]
MTRLPRLLDEPDRRPRSWRSRQRWRIWLGPGQQSRLMTWREVIGA